jgi:hypothetical protein
MHSLLCDRPSLSDTGGDSEAQSGRSQTTINYREPRRTFAKSKHNDIVNLAAKIGTAWRQQPRPLLCRLNELVRLRSGEPIHKQITRH